MQVIKPNLSGIDAPLIPFNLSCTGFGYVNFETFEIVIPPEYSFTNHFIGDFAIVRKTNLDIFTIINKNNSIIFDKLDYAALYETEDRQLVYAIIGKEGGRQWSTTSGWIKIPILIPSHTDYQVINLHTGQVLLKRREPYRSSRPKIILFDKYFIYDRDIFEIANDGKFIETDINGDAAAAQAAKERNLEDYFHITWRAYHFDTFHWSIEKIDMDKLFNIIPDNLRPYHYSLGNGVWETADWQERFLRDYTKVPINRNVNLPLVPREWLYQINMISNEGIRYFGLYNASKNEWEVSPIREINGYGNGEFYQTAFENWIVYHEHNYSGSSLQIFFNLKTKEEVRNVFLFAGNRMFYDGFSGDNNVFDSYLLNQEFDIQKQRDNMVYIEGGTFGMGNHDHGDIYQITLSPFYMNKYAVTQKDFHDLMKMNPAVYKYFDGADMPMTTVSWYDAVEYCNRLSLLEGLTPAYTIDKDTIDPNTSERWSTGNNLRWLVVWDQNANGYRLPTNAEWEYACRAGTETRFNTGDSINTRQANFNRQTLSFWKNAKPVGSYAPNQWGLYDMHGNVEEWCWDWASSRLESAVNPSGPVSGASRVIRGGSWSSSDDQIRSHRGFWMEPHWRLSFIGFRVVRNTQ